MRAALITIPLATAAGDRAGPALLAGKSLARRQLDFALAAGCRRIVVIGPGSPPELPTLRQAAEARGARLEAIADSAALSAAVGTDEELLVLAPGLLPESRTLLDILSRGEVVLVLPAASGTAAGFERIDLERAWAGAAMVPAALIGRLADLPDDIDPASALMRAAVQTRVPEHAVPEALLAAGEWGLWRAEEAGPAADRAWLLRKSNWLRTLPGWLASAVAPVAGQVVGSRRLAHLPWGAAALFLAGAIMVGWFGYPAAGFAMVALATMAARLVPELAALRQAPFGAGVGPPPLIAVAAADLALVLCGSMTIDGSWLQRLFPPLALMAALRLPATTSLAAAIGRRPVLAAGLAVASAAGLAEGAMMALALVLVIFAAPSHSDEAG